MLRIPALSPGEFRLIYMKNTPCPRGQSVWRKNFRAEKLREVQSHSQQRLGALGSQLAQVAVASAGATMDGASATMASVWAAVGSARDTVAGVTATVALPRAQRGVGGCCCHP